MSSIYIYDGPFEKGDLGFPLIRRAAALYAAERGLDFFPEETQIVREEKGKPYFKGRPLEFSLTHSGLLWMCMVGEKPCGLDLQQIKSCRYEELAARFFLPSERHYVELWGEEGFFDIWVRKEACCKCTGQGFFSEMPPVTDEDANLCEKITMGGAEYFLTEISISPEIKCAACTAEKTNIEMRVL